MANKFKKGDRVRVMAQTHGWADVKKGDIGTVVFVKAGGTYEVDFKAMDSWTGDEACFELVTPGGKKMSKKTSADVEKRVQKVIAWLAKRTPSGKKIKKTEPKPESFESKLTKKIETEAGCKNDVVRKIFTEIFDMRLVKERTRLLQGHGIKVGVGTVVVPLSNTNDNDYSIGEPCMILDVDNRQAFQMTGDLGNHLAGVDLADGFIADCRYATRDEIEAFARSEAVMKFLDL